MHQQWIMKAVQITKSQKKLADLAGINPDRINYLINEAKEIRLEEAIRIELATKGVVSRYHLIGYCEPALKRQEERGAKSMTELRVSERISMSQSYRNLKGDRQGMRTDLELRENFSEVQGRLEDEIAVMFLFNNRTTYRQALRVVEQGSLELIQAMDDERVSIYRAFTLLQLSHEEQKKLLSLSPKEMRKEFRRLDKEKISKKNDLNKFLQLTHEEPRNSLIKEHEEILSVVCNVNKNEKIFCPTCLILIPMTLSNFMRSTKNGQDTHR